MKRNKMTPKGISERRNYFQLIFTTTNFWVRTHCTELSFKSYIIFKYDEKSLNTVFHAVIENGIATDHKKSNKKTYGKLNCLRINFLSKIGKIFVNKHCCCYLSVQNVKEKNSLYHQSIVFWLAY